MSAPRHSRSRRHPVVPHVDRARVHFAESMTVRAAAAEIFPLLCPTREFDWIPYWSCRLVYTESGLAEPGCVFQTSFDGDAPGGVDTWVVSHFEPEERVSFVRVDRLRSIRYDVLLEPQDDGTTRLDWRQEITALSAEGDDHVRGLDAGDFTTMIGKVQKMLEHYLETGEALDLAA